MSVPLSSLQLCCTDCRKRTNWQFNSVQFSLFRKLY